MVFACCFGWFLLAPIVEQALLLTSLPPVAIDRLGKQRTPGVGIEAILLVVPVILATWGMDVVAGSLRWGSWLSGTWRSALADRTRR